ncbi:MAG: chemotaxis protein CheW [Nodosilinea sp. LVE1205-7]|jgi:twitching motility protein PilI
MTIDVNRFDPGESNQSSEVPISAGPEGELFLRFFVTSADEFVLGATGIHRIVECSPDRITPIPNVSPLLLGTLNEQGRVVWIADLAHFLGYPSTFNVDRPEISVIVVEDQGTMLGLAVNRIVGTQWLNPDATRMTARNTDNAMDPLLRGEWVLSPEGSETITLRWLDHLAVIRSARWAA